MEQDNFTIMLKKTIKTIKEVGEARNTYNEEWKGEKILEQEKEVYKKLSKALDLFIEVMKEGNAIEGEVDLQVVNLYATNKAIALMLEIGLNYLIGNVVVKGEEDEEEDKNVKS